MSRLVFEFEPLGSRSRRSSDREVTRILVIADLRGSAKAQGGLEAAGIVALSIDNFEDIMRRVQPKASVMAAGTRRTLTFESMQDFHPDALYPGIELFARSGGARAGDEKRVSEDDSATLERLLGRPASGPVPQSVLPAPQRSALDQMLREIVAPHIIQGPSQPTAAVVPATISDVMREVLHAPELQTVEATWRGLRWLVHENPLGAALEVEVLDASRDDLVADLRACGGELERSQLYRAVVRQRAAGPGARPYALVVGDYTFAGSDEDVSLLAGLGAVAAEAGGCFLGAADPVLWGCDDLARHPDRGDWVVPDRELAARLALLRGSAVAPFIGLCAPRVLGRLPYGKRSDPVDSFDFTELGEDPPHTAFLWLNGAYGCAQLIIASWAEGREPGSVVDLNDLPQAVYRFAGGDAIKPCAEVYLDESSADRILGCGVMPLMSYRNRNAVRLLRLQSIASPAAALAFGKALA